jgi:glucose-1-phosphate thymidylyltransferase
MWGIIPAAGQGTRIQPLAFSKELLPVGSQIDGGTERPKAVSEYLVERMVHAGVDRLCTVVAPGKSDILRYYGKHPHSACFCFVVQPEPRGLCDALFRALPYIAPDEHVLVGLPDTIWFPREGYCMLPDHALSFLLFPVDRPHLFDAVLTDARGRVKEIQVKSAAPGTPWIWGAFKLTGRILGELHALWMARDQADVYVGTLVNAYIADGGEAQGLAVGEEYVDVGTVNGYRQALALLAGKAGAPPESPPESRAGRAGASSHVHGARLA